MKYLLIFCIWGTGFSYDTMKYEVKDTKACQEMGHQLAKDLLTKIPDVRYTRFYCVEKGYGND